MSYVEELAKKHKELGITKHKVTWGPVGQTWDDEKKAKFMLAMLWETERGYWPKSSYGPPCTKNRYKIMMADRWSQFCAWGNRMRDKSQGITNPYKD